MFKDFFKFQKFEDQRPLSEIIKEWEAEKNQSQVRQSDDSPLSKSNRRSEPPIDPDE